MTKILFKFKDGHIVYFEIKGHTNFADYGSDIVCASISSTAIMTINGLLEVIRVKGINYSIRDGYLNCNLLNVDNLDDTDILTKSLYQFLIDVEKQYPQNVKLKTEEL